MPLRKHSSTFTDTLPIRKSKNKGGYSVTLVFLRSSAPKSEERQLHRQGIHRDGGVNSQSDACR